MRLLARLLEPRATAHAHCDLPCGVYDPAQARIEAESVRGICEKYQQNTDPEFRARAIQIKEERSDLVKHHLWVLSTWPRRTSCWPRSTRSQRSSGRPSRADTLGSDPAGGPRGQQPGAVLCCIKAV